MIEQLGDIGYLVFFISSVLFTLAFLTLSKAWFKSFMGVVIAIYLVGTDIMCFYFGLRIFEVTLPGVEYIRFFIFWILGLTMLSAVAALYNVQFSRRGEKLRKRLSKKYADLDKEKSNQNNEG